MALGQWPWWVVEESARGRLYPDRRLHPERTVLFVPVSLLQQVPRFPWRLLCYGSAAAIESLDPECCDDFIPSDWSAAELRFRLRRMVRPRALRCGDQVLSWGDGWVSGGDKPVLLNPGQCRILDALLRAGPAGVSRTTLHALVEREAPGATRLLDMHVSRLRRRLAEATSRWQVKPRIVAVRGVGYRVVLPDRHS